MVKHEYLASCNDVLFGMKQLIPLNHRPRRHSHSYDSSSSNAETVPIENWTYDCGSNDFIYVLTFEGDRLIKEDTKGRGSKSGDCSYE